MIVYLDTNVYIGAKYQFSNDKFNTLRSLIADGTVQIIYSSVTQGEVEQHIRTGVKEGVTSYNRVLRKELPSLIPITKFNLRKIEIEDAVNAVINGLSEFLSLNGVIKIDLNPLDAEQLMDDYFQCRLPFEDKKPYEFKDAIMINAIRKYQQQVKKEIIVVSNDEGVRKSFEGENGFITFEYLGDLIGFCMRKKAEYAAVETCIKNAIENNEFGEIIQEYLEDCNIERWDYSEWECEEHQIDSFKAKLSYIKYDDERYKAYIDLELVLVAEIRHRDEDMSYFDREENRYLFENHVTWREYHGVEKEIIIDCLVEKDEDNKYVITDSLIIDEGRFPTLDLDDRTMEGYEELRNECHEESDV